MIGRQAGDDVFRKTSFVRLANHFCCDCKHREPRTQVGATVREVIGHLFRVQEIL